MSLVPLDTSRDKRLKTISHNILSDAFIVKLNLPVSGIHSTKMEKVISLYFCFALSISEECSLNL